MKKFILCTFIWYLPLQLKLPNIPFFPVINLLTILMLGLLINSRNDNFKRPKFELPLFLFFTIWMLSFVWACMTTDGMPRIEILREFKRLYLLPIGYFVFSRCMQDKKEVKYYFAAFLLVLVFAGHNTLRNGVLAGANFALHKRSSGPFGWGWRASDIAGGFLATFTPFLISYFFFCRKKFPKLLSAIGIAYCGLGLMATYSRGSMMALLFACVTLIIVGSHQLAKESKVNFLVIFIGLILGTVFWKAWVPKAIIQRVEGTYVTEEVTVNYDDDSADEDYGEAGLDASSQLRIQAWQAGINFFKENPFTGIGFRQVQFQLGHDPHNAFVLIASEMGIMGILIFIWMIFAITGESFKLFGTEFNNIGVGFVGTMVGFTIVNMFYSNFFRDTVVGSFWMMLGLLAAGLSLSQNSPQTENSNKEEPELRKKTYADYRKRYLRSFAWIVFMVAFCATSAHAKVDSRWWQTEDVAHLNAYEDIGFKMKRGNIYYVDGKNGHDKNNGQTITTPFKSIKKGLRKLKAGDMLLIKAGIYRDQFWITSQGTEESPVVIGPFGDGEVIIDAGMKVSEWEKYEGSIYRTTVKKQPRVIVADELPLYPVRELTNITEGSWYWDDDNKMIYLHVPQGDSPDNHDVGVIVNSKYAHALFLNGASHVIIYGLTIRFAGGKGIEILGSNNHIERCNIKFNGFSGIGMFSYKKTNSNSSKVIKNHIFHNMLANWPRGRWPYKGGGWGMGIIGSAQSIVVGNVVHKNGGEGIGAASSSVVQDNIVYNNWSVNIYSDGSENVSIDRNLIYCEEPDWRDLHNNNDRTPEDNKSFRRLRAEGIMTGDETKKTNNNNIQITNNIIIGCRRGVTHYGRTKSSGLKNVLVAHNTIIVPDTKGTDESFIGIKVPWNNGNNVGTVYRNNIIYATHPDTYLAVVHTDPISHKDAFHGVTFNHNLWYHKTRKTPFHVGLLGVYFHQTDFSGWKKRGKNEDVAKGSNYADPKFVRREGYTLESVQVSADSPAVDSALLVESILTDHVGNSRDELPDMGALELIREL